MKIIKSTLFCMCMVLSVAVPSLAKEWRSIVPLHSTRADVERLIGKHHIRDNYYGFENETVQVIYNDYAGDNPCEKGFWNVSRNTVISINVTPKTKLRFFDLHIDLRKYKKTRDPHVSAYALYADEEEGVTYGILEGGKEDGLIQSITYGPAAKDAQLRCPDAAAKQPCKKLQSENL